MFSIRAARRSDDASRARRANRAERVQLLAIGAPSDLEPGGYYTDLGFRPPGD